MNNRIAIVPRLFLFLLMIVINGNLFAYDFKVNGLCYNVLSDSEKTVELTWEAIGSPYTGNIVVPQTVDNNGITYLVTKIGDFAMLNLGQISDGFCSYSSNTELLSVSIPNSVTIIGNNVFSGCTGLTSITIPNSVANIGSFSFSGCTGLTSITIPNSVTSIYSTSFSNCSGLTSIKVESGNTTYDSRNNCNAIIKKSNNQLIAGCKNTAIPNSVTSIGDNAFNGCSGLTSISIPNSVTNLESSAFQNCTGLSSITIPNSVTSIGGYVFDGCSGLTSITIGSGIRTIGNGAFASCQNLTDVYCQAEKVPSTYENAFENSYIEHATLHVPESSISSYKATAPWSGFKAITDLNSGNTGNEDTAPSGTFEIGGIYYNLIGKGKVAEVTSHPNKYSGDIVIPSSVIYGGYSYSVTSIGEIAFSGSKNLQSVSIPQSITYIGDNAFSGCSDLTSISIPNSVTSIGREAFWYCSSLTSVTIPNSVTSIGQAAFGCSGLTSVTIPNGVTTIGHFTFQECRGLVSVTIPNSVTSIEQNAFLYCTSLTSVTIPNSVSSISLGSFSGCRSLTTVTIGSGISYIGSRAFASCQKLTDVYCHAEKVPTASENAFENSYIEHATLHVPESSISSYKATAPWSGFKAITSIEEKETYSLGITAIGNGSVSYGGTTIRGNTSSFIVNEGTSASLTFTPDNGYRIKSVIVNGTDVTSNVSNNQYTISNINANTTVSVTFEAIPVTTYTLSITASGIGTVLYGGTKIYKSTSTFTVTEGTSATISFSYSYGYRIKKVVVNGVVVTSFVSGNKYTINSIKKDTTVEVEFEAIPYTLSITAKGNGSVSYSGTTIRGNTSSFNVNEGTSVTLTFTPDNGYRVKSVIVNGTDVTSNVVNNQYTISNINANTTVSVEFEAIPQTTYSLMVLSSDGGSVSYSGVTVHGSYKFIVIKGASATLTFTPDNGYRIKSVTVNGIDVTSSVSKNQYTISDISQNTTVNVTFEEIPQTTYSLTITATGNGSVSYNGTSIRRKTSSYNINEGSTLALKFTPDNGYCIKSVIVNGADVTSGVMNNQLTISKINQNITVEVTFEAIPPTTYTLTITASSGGTVTYNGVTIGNNKLSYTVNEGSSATLTFTPDNGYRIMSVVVNGTDLTSRVTNNQYTISGIRQNTTVEVTFEAIPPTTYTLSITSSGNGSVTYSATAIRGTTKSFTVNENLSATLTFTPDNGYRIKSVIVNGTDVTLSVSNNQYTISSIQQNTTVEVTFEAIPPTTYTLAITSSGRGSITYSATTIRGSSKSFTVKESTSATLTFIPDTGYRIKSVIVNGTDVTSSVSNNQYTISSIQQNTTVDVTFEAIPPSYTLTIIPSGNGSVSYNATTIRNATKVFTVVEGTSHLLTFSPDNGHYLEAVKVNGADVTPSVSNNQYTLNDISENTTVVVTFKEELKDMSVNNVNYKVTSYKDKTVNVASGNYGNVLTVPDTFNYDGQIWMVKGIESGALANETDLAAIVWNPNVAFTESVPNPNLLLYVKSSSYAPKTVNNVIVNNVAAKITLTEAESGNDFYCPQAFTARSITYTHSYQMTTGIDKCQGWETIALPFDVQTIKHETKGFIVPFAARSNSGQKMFWLYELTNSGWRTAPSIKANTPYIISMPNNDLYFDEVRLNGRVTFSATDVTVPATTPQTALYRNRTFIPNYKHQNKNESIFTLNVNNEWYGNNTYGLDGSMFVVNQRCVSPFEAYMQAGANSARNSFGIFEDMTTEIRGVEEMVDARRVSIYNMSGQKRKTVNNESIDELRRKLPAGVYIINGQKVIVR